MLSFTHSSPDAAQNIQTMRLRDDPPQITTQQRKKRKTNTDEQPATPQPPPAAQQPQQPAQQPQPQQQQQLPPPPPHILPPPHALMQHLPSGPIPPGYPYVPGDYTPGGMPQQAPPLNQIMQQALAAQHAAHQQQAQQQQAAGKAPSPSAPESPPTTGAQRALSSTKRAEQNRKAQRAFRERRDQSVLSYPS